MDEVKVIQVIYCTKHRRGDGKSENDPVRIIPEIFSLEGEKIMENDSERIFTTKDVKDLVEFAMHNSGRMSADTIIAQFKRIHSIDQR